ncbi:MAG: aminopeptidase P family N-terminal domain-containing protein [Bacteroidaceae bacterium]|nr:aminopeptidase P family N-terminal domain-containing protein [Bacteroidaceae bacterium]
MITERLNALRKMMRREGWDAVIVPGSDPHSSEYLPARWQQRQFISSFTGSYGTVVITLTHAGLWTDTRYFIQFEKELVGTEFVLHKLRVPEAVQPWEWLGEALPQGGVVCIDGSCMSVSEVDEYRKAIQPKGGRLDNRPDFINELWPDRPETPDDPIWVLDDIYTGRSAADKLGWLRGCMAEKGCDAMLVNSLDEVAWLLNIRSDDIDFTPVVIAYLLVEKGRITLFTNPKKVVTADVKQHLNIVGCVVKPYGEITEALRSLPFATHLWVDGSTLNEALYECALEGLKENVVNLPSPIRLEKGLKNDVELNGFRRAYLKDGIVQTKLFKWLEESLAAGVRLTEMDVADKQVDLRRAQGEYVEESFAPISAWGENAALPHYEPTHEVCSEVLPKGLFLLDSGGHYLHGSTDITRTIPLGPLTDLEREDYTLVLKGMIGLATAIFPRGTRGANIDVLARIPLWKSLRNFGHGTGHGTGHVLCVHEGPQDLRQNVYDQAMLPGMVTSDEPGLYREGMHGVRHENVILCKEIEKNEFGDWLGFETLTCTYIDPSPVVVELLTQEERDWLNNYNEYVYIRLLPWLDEDEKHWLQGKIYKL